MTPSSRRIDEKQCTMPRYLPFVPPMLSLLVVPLESLRQRRKAAMTEAAA